jgi:hypothetical protein
MMLAIILGASSRSSESGSGDATKETNLRTPSSFAIPGAWMRGTGARGRTPLEEASSLAGRFFERAGICASFER